MRAAEPADAYARAVPSIEGVSLASAFGCAIAVNFTASCAGLVVITAGHFGSGLLVPMTCMALTGVIGLVALPSRRTRRIGGGSLLGLLVSMVGFVAGRQDLPRSVKGR